MKKYILIFAGVFILLPINTVAASPFKKEVIIFSQPCHYCELMKKDLDSEIIPANPDIKFTILNITKPENHKLLIKYVKQYKIEGNNIGLPLIFVGNNYIMGWGDNAVGDLNNYLNEFKEEKITRLPVAFD